jgi:Tol biopolymer transport system component
LIGRCLAKDPKRRLRDIGDARLELDEPLALPAPDAPQQPGRARLRWLVPVIVALLVGAAATFAILTRAGRSGSSPAPAAATLERMTFDSGMTMMPSLSPDGRLIAYASDRARGDLDIWVQQTNGGAALRLTDDPADDQMPDFSPDGSQIVFRSERANRGLYLVSALGGNARLVAPDGRWPRFSPDGSRIVYWSGQWRGTPSMLSSAVYVLTLNGGTPTRLLQDFVMARDARWAPDGRSLMVLARHDETTPLAQSYDWWWVPLDGRPPVKSGIFDLYDFRHALDREDPGPGTWTTDAGFVLASEGSLWQIPIDGSTGRVAGAPRQLTFGAGTYGHPTIDRAGHVAFAVFDSDRVMERVSIEPGHDAAAPTTLQTDAGYGAGRPSETADGRTLLFERNGPRSQEIWIKNLRSNEQRLVHRVDAPTGVDPVISPDGSRIAYTVGRRDDDGKGYAIDAAGGVPKQICDGCGVHGFLSDNRRILTVMRGKRAIAVVDVVSGASQDAFVVDDGEVSRPHASPDDRWLMVRRIAGTNAKMLLGPLTPGRPPARDAWTEIDEPTTTGRPCGWSLDSRTAYMLLDVDGFRCLWGQRVDPAAGRPVGTPFVVRHFHRPQEEQFSTSYGNPFTVDGFLYGGRRLRANLWRLIPAGTSDTSK